MGRIEEKEVKSEFSGIFLGFLYLRFVLKEKLWGRENENVKPIRNKDSLERERKDRDRHSYLNAAIKPNFNQRSRPLN